MIVFESRKARRIVGRLERGERVVEAVESLARERSVTTGWVRAVGHLEWAEVRRFDPRARTFEPIERVEAPSRIVSLEGSVSFVDGVPRARLLATLVRPTPAGPVLFGGEMVDAGAFAVELVIECLDDLGLRRERDADTGLELWAGARTSAQSDRGAVRNVVFAHEPFVEADEPPARGEPPPRAAAPEVRGPVSWAQVAAVSETPRRDVPPPRPKPGMGRPSVLTQAREPAPVPDPIPPKRRADLDELLDEPIPEQGDYVDHKVFGLCRVEGEDAEGGIVIRLPSGARKHINLDVLEVLPGRIETDRVVYPVRPRRR